LSMRKSFRGDENRRDVLWLLGVTLLALLPLWLIWRKSAPAPVPVVPLSGAASLGLTPVLSPVPTGTPGASGSSYQVPAQLSPSGRYLARMENANGKEMEYPPSDLVARTRNGREVFCTPAPDQTFFWFGNSLVTLDQSVGVATAYNLSAPPTGRAPILSASQFTFGVRPGGSDSHLFLSQDGSLLTLVNWEGGLLMWSVLDMVSGKTLADRVGAGDVLENGSFFNLSFAVAPLATKWPKGVVGPVVVVSQVMPEPTPMLTAAPRPTPPPTPSPAQQAFEKREKEEDAKIQTLMRSIQGVDGNDPKETDPARIAQITAEIKRRDRALDDERARLPATPTPLSLATSGQAGRVQCFDLGKGRLLWQRATRSQTRPARVLFSPDGSRLLLAGVARMVPNGSAMSVWDSGVDVLDPATGRPLAHWTFGTSSNLSSFSWKESPSVYFLSGAGSSSSVAVRDESFLNGASGALRFFDQSTLRETSYIPLSRDVPCEKLSPDAGGNGWLAQQSGDVYLLSRGQLGRETFGPLPLPTLVPTQASQTPSGRAH